MIPVEHGITRVIGYRVFRVLQGDLYAINFPQVWRAAGTTASCYGVGRAFDPTLDPAHMASCTCGLYAWHLPRELQPFRSCAVGVVEGYETVAWCPTGWRASKARIVALTSAAILTSRYVDTPRFSSVVEMVGEYPPHMDERSVPLPGMGSITISLANAKAVLDDMAAEMAKMQFGTPGE